MSVNRNSHYEILVINCSILIESLIIQFILVQSYFTYIAKQFLTTQILNYSLIKQVCEDREGIPPLTGHEPATSGSRFLQSTVGETNLQGHKQVYWILYANKKIVKSRNCLFFLSQNYTKFIANKPCLHVVHVTIQSFQTAL